MITVESIKRSDARTDNIAESFSMRYADDTGLTRIESYGTSSMSDFGDSAMERISRDNGKTWGEWKDVYEEGYEDMGEHDRALATNYKEYYNPVHKHYVSIDMERIFKEGHKVALAHIWNYNGPSYLSDHTYLFTRIPGQECTRQLIKYEDGAEFDRNDPINPEYFYKNTCYTGSNLVIDEKGDIFFPIGAPVAKCCKLAGLDVNEVFPSKPNELRGLIVVHGTWNGESYDLSYSRPVVISDLQSSRGMDEPSIALLKTGRILVVFRGAYYINPKWNTRIEPGTPGFKWYTYSDDGGKTFTPAMPWHFDDGEVIYSSSSIAHFFRDERNGRLYWIGNITGHVVRENWPRWPLCIVEVDETYGTAKKESYTVIDTVREGESDQLQLSNFNLLQDRETGRLEIRLTKYNQFPNRPGRECECWTYYVTLPE